MHPLYALLPPAWRPHAKAAVAALGAVLAALVVALPTAPEWVPVALAFVTALGVWGVPNADADGDGIPDVEDPYADTTRGRHAA